MHVGMDGGFGMAAGRAHLLDEVIDNIKVSVAEFARSQIRIPFKIRL